jgi:hypothetical protein
VSVQRVIVDGGDDYEIAFQYKIYLGLRMYLFGHVEALKEFRYAPRINPTKKQPMCVSPKITNSKQISSSRTL